MCGNVPACRGFVNYDDRRKPDAVLS